MNTLEAKEEFSKIFEELGKSLDITEAQHLAVVQKYEAVGNHLTAAGSPLSIYKPQILPQGSFILGTMTKPVNEEDELDIDVVCRLEGKKPDWTQFDLKQAVGDRLKADGTYKKMLDEEGRRCWTLNYSTSPKFHMDILPAIVGQNYQLILDRAFSAKDLVNIQDLAIRITDNKEANYHIAKSPEEWLKSNPFGYARWFHFQKTISSSRTLMMSESVKPVPAYEKEKSPLQRVIQILKRHRDIMFNGDDDKPISIIITTLAARAYQKEISITEALLNILDRMPLFIEERYDPKYKRNVKWIPNPVNEQENFADKWPSTPKKEENFYNWLKQASHDIKTSMQQTGIYNIQNLFESSFGKAAVNRAFSNYAENNRVLRENGKQHISAKTGTLGLVGTVVKNHNFFGNEEK